MKKGIKKNIARACGQNMELNRRALRMKKSWDEVSAFLDKIMKKRR